MKIISTPHLSFHILTYICSHMPWSMYALEPILLLLLLDSAPKRTSFSTPSRSLCPSRVPFYALWLWCLDSVLSLPNSGILWLLCSTWKTHIFFSRATHITSFMKTSTNVKDRILFVLFSLYIALHIYLCYGKMFIEIISVNLIIIQFSTLSIPYSSELPQSTSDLLCFTGYPAVLV